ncbi:MAG: GMC oxidoreductase [Acidobacteriota bacterium]
MLIDARHIPSGKVVSTDLCIVGSGAAGITLAREFLHTRTSVSLLEAGGDHLDDATQAMYRGEGHGPLLAHGDRYVQWSRLRFFGGSTNHWAGWCRPLDPIDLEERSWVPRSGWPFPLAVLDPYYQAASSLCQIQPVRRDLREWSGTPRAPLPFDPGSDLTTKMFHFSPPTRFGKVYGPEILRAHNLETFLHADVVALFTGENGRRVLELEAASAADRRFRVRARQFVLAAGGIENARLLLLSRQTQKEGLGNGHGLVGRYFADHPHFHAGSIVFTRHESLDLYMNDAVDPILGHESLGVLCTSEAVQRREKLLNFSVEFLPVVQGKLPEADRKLGRLAEKVDRGFRSAPATSPLQYADLYARAEPSPHPDSRVFLLEERDALGRNLVRLDWKLHRGDSRSASRSLEILARELGRLGRGRIGVRISAEDPWPEGVGGEHHLGTTRMHSDSRQGVVDAQGQVHGVENLHLAGSSVFPTYGFANPTLTLVALTLRLADHLKRRLEE